MKKYKYLVTIGCSQTFGQGCEHSQTYPNLLGKKLGLEVINLAVCGSGWYALETSLMSFINNNRSILDECFFILQKSALDRRVNYQEIATCRTDVWQKWNIKYLSQVAVASLGYNDWKKYYFLEHKPEWWPDEPAFRQNVGAWIEPHNIINDLSYFPEHKHYPNSRNQWKIGNNHNVNPPYIHEQFQELMLHWALRISSLHLFLKNLNLDHIIVDGYSPFLSYKLNFTNYYDTHDEYEMVKEFWSTNTVGVDVDDVMIYDFKNIQAGWIFDSIDIKYKVDDVILWSLYQFKQHDTKWNIDGGHAGPLGMNLIADVLHKNLLNKGWFI